MTEEFLKIAEAKTALKGSFIGTIIKAGDLKSGTKDGRDWTKKVFTVHDDSADLDLVCWGAAEIEKFTVGGKYEFTKPWFKVYDGNISAQLGKYGSAKMIGSANTEELQQPTTQQKIDPPKDSKLVVRCPHGLEEKEGYVCKKCLVAYYEGLVKEMRDHIGQ